MALLGDTQLLRESDSNFAAQGQHMRNNREASEPGSGGQLSSHQAP